MEEYEKIPILSPDLRMLVKNIWENSLEQQNYILDQVHGILDLIETSDRHDFERCSSHIEVS